jgi:hypothetical protein
LEADALTAPPQPDFDTENGGSDNGDGNGMIVDPPSSHDGCSPRSRIPEDLAQISAARMQQSINHLEAASQTVRLRITDKEQSDKSTMPSYERHVSSYVTWWDAYQVKVVDADPTQVMIPAIPVTAAKATMFLEYTSTRPKVNHTTP